jgi:hypothetical protein
MTTRGHELQDDTIVLWVEGAPPNRCQVTAPNGRTYWALVRRPPEAGLPGRRFTVRYPQDFHGAPAVEPGHYQAVFRGDLAYGGKVVPPFVVPERVTGERVPHQLTIHLDYHPTNDLDLRWSYPYSAPHDIPEQRIRWSAEDLPKEACEALDVLVEGLLARVPGDAVHVPHRDVTPEVERGVATFAIQDQARPEPRARLFFTTQIRGVGRRVGGEAALTEAEMAPAETEQWNALRSWAKGRAWDDYTTRFAAP